MPVWSVESGRSRITSGDPLGPPIACRSYLPAVLIMIGRHCWSAGCPAPLAASWSVRALLLFLDLLGEFALLGKRVVNISRYAPSFGGPDGIAHSLPTVPIGPIPRAAALAALGLADLRWRDLH